MEVEYKKNEDIIYCEGMADYKIYFVLEGTFELMNSGCER